jgi:rod shape-determining protein MreC
MPSMGGRKPRSSQGFRRSDTSSGAGLTAALLVALSVFMFALGSQQGSGFFSGARSAFSVITTPVRAAGAVISVPFGALENIARNLTASGQTLSELEAENASLKAQNAELEEAQQTAARLEELLNVQNSYNLTSVAARVIGSSADSWSSTVTIDKGSLAGLDVGMSVVCSDGVIGQISQCDATSSVVRLVNDENSSVSAMIQSSRAQGMLEGSPDGSVSLSLIRTDQTVNVGDTVVTSGLGGVFPKGLPIGQVSGVSRTPGALYYTIEVKLFTQPRNLEEVLVITSLSDDQQATEADIAEADAQESGSTSSDSSTSTESSTSQDTSSSSTQN